MASVPVIHKEMLLLGCRIPKHYFMTKGFGETDAGEGSDPWETGAYDLALLEAGIPNFNIMQYTSVMPKDAIELPLDQAKRYFVHGAVLETIMSAQNGQRGERLTVGVGMCQIRRLSNGEVIGGFAAEYKYKGLDVVTKAQCEEILTESLKGIFERRGYDPSQYEMIGLKFCIRKATIEKKYGSILAAICFLTYETPVVVPPPVPANTAVAYSVSA